MVHKGYLDTILGPILRRLQVHAHSEGKTVVADNLGKGFAGVAVCPATPADAPRPPRTEEPIQNNWTDLALAELMEFNRNGFEGITCVSEATWKVQATMNQWSRKNPKAYYYFRGQHRFGWTLDSSASRHRKPTDPPIDLESVSKNELDRLRKFQKDVETSADLKNDVFPRSDIPHAEDRDWWGHMQHYQSGTRLLDVTSSIFAGLWFACANWDGTVNDKEDGALYLVPTKPPEDSTASDVIGSAPPFSLTASSCFDAIGYPEQVRFWRMRSRNDRVLAQDGYFFWQPRFDKPLDVGQHFKFRVAADKKRSLLVELSRIGYTAERVVAGAGGKNAGENLLRELS